MLWQLYILVLGSKAKEAEEEAEAEQKLEIAFRLLIDTEECPVLSLVLKTTRDLTR